MSVAVPAPVGGWNARDSLDAMSPTDAIELINYFPGQASIETRAGTTLLAEDLGGEVETLAVFRDGTQESLLAAANGKLQEVALSDGNLTERATGLTNDRWQWINFNGRLILVNGADTPREWQGVAISTITISGVTSSDLIGLTSFKGRVFYWEDDAQSFWYAAAGAYAGALTEFPLGIVSQSGGKIVECCTWTRDGGDGLDDLFVILMSTGEVLIYQGDDPGSNFSLIGRFQIGSPLSVRGSVNVGSERVIATKDGYLNLSAALSAGRATDAGNISAKIIKAAKQAANDYADNFGWEMTLYPKESMLIVNVPVDPDTTAAQSTYEQHVLNTTTGAWCKFTGWNAITFATVSDQLYFGDPDGNIFKAYVGPQDTESGGDSAFIQASVIPAFNPLTSGAVNKHLTTCTVVSDHYLPQYMEVHALSDFNVPTPGSLRTPPDGEVAEWNVSDWDDDFWASSGGNEAIKAENYPVGAYGYMLSARLRVQSKIQRIRIYSIKYQKS